MFLTRSYWLSQPTFDTMHQTDSLTTDSRLTGVGKAYLTYITDTNISAAIQMCALTDSLEERVDGDD